MFFFVCVCLFVCFCFVFVFFSFALWKSACNCNAKNTLQTKQFDSDNVSISDFPPHQISLMSDSCCETLVADHKRDDFIYPVAWLPYIQSKIHITINADRDVIISLSQQTRSFDPRYLLGKYPFPASFIELQPVQTHSIWPMTNRRVRK